MFSCGFPTLTCAGRFGLTARTANADSPAGEGKVRLHLLTASILLCLFCSAPVADAGLLLQVSPEGLLADQHSARWQEVLQLDESGMTASASGSAQAGAGADDRDASRRDPFVPLLPAGPYSGLPWVIPGMASTAGGQGVSPPTVVSSAGAMASAMSAARVALPQPSPRFQKREREFLFLPDAPKLGLFRPPTRTLA